MTEIVSIKFKNRGKCYFFSPDGLQIDAGQCVIVETSKGLEIADCIQGNHFVEDETVVQPLRPVVRIATQDDLRIVEINKVREKDAFEICRQKIEDHGLEMKLVDVECNFEGNKTTFFFTADGRVDFRELVKDLASVFRNRIELRQIGVRDEAKMLGGIGICGRPYCCSQFLEEFQPVSTKMAKTQSLSLNPTKISGSCGRLMCCLRYEEEAYEELIKTAPKQGAFVQTKDGYGTAMQVNLLRQSVKVKLDNDTDDTLHSYAANEFAVVPGGRPKEGEPLPDVFTYTPEPQEEPEVDRLAEWERAAMTAVQESAEEPKTEEPQQSGKKPHNGYKDHRRKTVKPKAEAKTETKAETKPEAKPETEEVPAQAKKSGYNNRRRKPYKPKNEGKGEQKVEAKPAPKTETAPAKKPQEKKLQPTAKNAENKPADAPQEKKPHNNRRYYYHGKPKSKTGGKAE